MEIDSPIVRKLPTVAQVRLVAHFLLRVGDGRVELPGSHPVTVGQSVLWVDDVTQPEELHLALAEESRVVICQSRPDDGERCLQLHRLTRAVYSKTCHNGHSSITATCT